MSMSARVRVCVCVCVHAGAFPCVFPVPIISIFKLHLAARMTHCKRTRVSELAPWRDPYLGDLSCCITGPCYWLWWTTPFMFQDGTDAPGRCCITGLRYWFCANTPLMFQDGADAVWTWKNDRSMVYVVLSYFVLGCFEGRFSWSSFWCGSYSIR